MASPREKTPPTIALARTSSCKNGPRLSFTVIRTGLKSYAMLTAGAIIASSRDFDRVKYSPQLY